MNVRTLAFDILMKMNKGAYSNLTLDGILSSHKGLSDKDRSFLCALVYGATERRLTLDYQLSTALSKPLSKLRPEVLIILRLGVYQLLFMDRVPDGAAVNESVNLVKACGCDFASALVNAVLHKVAQNGLQLPDEKKRVACWSIKYSCADWIVGSLIKQYGLETAQKILESSIQIPKLYLRVNTTKITPRQLSEELNKEGYETEITPLARDALRVLQMKAGSAIDESDCYRKGLFHVQDVACQNCCEALQVQKGMTVLDLCAAPGGKSFTVAEMMENEGVVKSFDIFPHKIQLMESGAERLGLSIIMPCVNDATVFRAGLQGADRVLCDVPCSGIGIMARKPEIKYKLYDTLKDLPQLQMKILETGACYVKPGGLLIYSTCTILKKENESVCDSFLQMHPDFSLQGAYHRFLPGVDDTDGFFYAVMKKEGQ